MEKIHIVGVGGIAMSAIAQYLFKQGYQVSGSDLKANQLTDKLAKLGIDIEIGHAESNLSAEVQRVIYSAAIPDNNIELLTAKKRGLKLMGRSEALAWMTENKSVVSVAGTHGKTTTSGMIAHALTIGNFKPNFIIGGILNNFTSNYKITGSDLFVLEGDEYNRSFLNYKTDLGVLLNIEFDHPDIYDDYEDLSKTYQQYVEELNELLITNHKVIKELKLNELELDIDIWTVGIEDDQADFNAVEIREKGFESFFVLEYNGNKVAEFRIPVLGKYNIKHALETIAVARYFNISWSDLKRALANWKGVKRRFDLLENNSQRVIISDYAHHPSELKAVSSDLARIKMDKKKVLIFQPHQFIRTKELFDSYKNVLTDSFDQIIIQKIYTVREEVAEDKIESLGQDLANIIAANAKYCNDFKELEQFLTKYNKNNEAIYLFTGAGDIDDFARQWAEK